MPNTVATYTLIIRIGIQGRGSCLRFHRWRSNDKAEGIPLKKTLSYPMFRSLPITICERSSMNSCSVCVLYCVL